MRIADVLLQVFFCTDVLINYSQEDLTRILIAIAYYLASTRSLKFSKTKTPITAYNYKVSMKLSIASI